MSRGISHLRAVVYALLAFTLWAVADSFTKLAGQSHLPPSQIIIVSSIFCVLTIVGVAAARGNVARLKPVRWKLELLRALLFTALSYMNVIAFTHFPLTAVYVVLFTCPMLVALFAAVGLRESLSWAQGLAILAGFGGVLIALRPAQEDFGNSFIVATIALVLFPVLSSTNTVLVRYLGRTEHSESMAFFPIMARLFIVLPFFVHKFQPMTGEQIFYLAGLGSLAAIGMLFMMDALKNAPAALVWPFQYSQLISGAVLGYLFWQETPSLQLAAGSLVIIASGLYLAHHARQERLKAALLVKP